ncbi:hypothetical protein AVEN_135653-1 [Araneus ventricosus]|uniref:Uncharacterized protein n=1 Tax=Araneus ventricosus TaxID=182803 RepID=A0A4Y2EH74_ARAVE|nr:hypothetical protein AVEN_135653-1 [Araneus ventricosus]
MRTHHSRFLALLPDSSSHKHTLSGPFTVAPFFYVWNTGKKNQSPRSKTYEIWSKWNGSGGIPANSKSKTPSADSNLGPRCEASDKTKDLPTLGPRVEATNETRNTPCRGGGEWMGRVLRL